MVSFVVVLVLLSSPAVLAQLAYTPGYSPQGASVSPPVGAPGPYVAEPTWAPKGSPMYAPHGEPVPSPVPSPVKTPSVSPAKAPVHSPVSGPSMSMNMGPGPSVAVSGAASLGPSLAAASIVSALVFFGAAAF